MEFGLIPPEHWLQPDSIDEDRATASRNKMMEDNIIYGGSVSYRNMCRYNSGVRTRLSIPGLEFVWLIATFIFRQFFYKHPLLLKYRWYWRIECVNYILSSKFYPYFFFSPLDLTSTFTVIFYMTRFYIWKNTRKFIVRHFAMFLSLKD